MQQDPYAILGVSRDAESVVIEAAYRALMKKYHPDRTVEAGAQKRAREINAAYDILKDPARRAAFDAESGSPDHRSSPGTEPQPGLAGQRRRRGLTVPAVIGALALIAAVSVMQRSQAALDQSRPIVADPVSAPPLPKSVDGVTVEATSEPETVPPASLKGLRLTTEGLGPVRIGMSRQEVEAAVGPLTVNHESGDCASLTPAIADFVQILVEKDRVTRVSAYREPSIRTPRDIGAGSTTQAVRAAYGSALEEDPHIYAGAPAQYLTYLVPAGEGGAPGEGVRFETGPDGLVTAVHGGQGSLGYVEGCL